MKFFRFFTRNQKSQNNFGDFLAGTPRSVISAWQIKQKVLISQEVETLLQIYIV